MGFDLTIAVFTATFWEFRAVQRALSSFRYIRTSTATRLTGFDDSRRVVLIRTGIGPIKAARACQDLCSSEGVDLIIASGFIGGLHPADVGTLVVAHSVESVQPWPDALPVVEGLRCHHAVMLGTVELGNRLEMPMLQGKVVTAGRILPSSHEKRRMAEKTGAVGVDMESAAIGWVAHEHRCPFLVIRSITDGVSNDLPVDFNLFLSPRGWVHGIGALMSPQRIKEMYRLKCAMDRASRVLTNFFHAFFASATWEPVSKSQKVLGHG